MTWCRNFLQKIHFVEKWKTKEKQRKSYTRKILIKIKVMPWVRFNGALNVLAVVREQTRKLMRRGDFEMDGATIMSMTYFVNQHLDTDRAE